MAQFSVNTQPQRFDPYKNFKFRVKWDGKYVAGVSKVGSLKRTTEVVKHRDGGDPSSSRKSPGRTEYEAITLERGVTHDKDFEQWANKVWNYGSGLGAEVALKDFRKDVIIEVYNEAGQVAITYKVYRCWVSEFQSMPDLDANANAVAIQNIKLENEGWERDYEVVEPPSQPLPNQADPVYARIIRFRPFGYLGARAGRTPVDQALEILRAAFPQTTEEALARLDIGQRDICLLRLRSLTFSPQIKGLADCPACSQRLELDFDTRDLPGSAAKSSSPLPDPESMKLFHSAASLRVDDYEVTFRLPNSLDLSALSKLTDAESRRQQLLEACVVSVQQQEQSLQVNELPSEALNALVERMSQEHPLADLTLPVTCPACGNAWEIIFDIVSYFWNEINAWSMRLIREVHTLAAIYGWREADILAMSAWRRQRYLEMIGV